MAATSRAANWLGVGAIAWFFAFAIAYDYGLEAIGFHREQRSMLVRLAAIAIALGPGLIFVSAPVLGRVRGFRWLLATTQPRVTITPIGLELRLPELGVGWFSWDEVGSLVKKAAGWRPGSDLRAPDGTLLVWIPRNLVYFDISWRSSRSLAQAVVEMRPDRFALSAATWAGWPDGFALRDSGQPIVRGSDRWAGRRRLVSVVLVLAAAAAVLIFLSR